MSFLNRKAEPVRPGDVSIPAGAINLLREGMPRQIRGSDGVSVEQMGDRFSVRGPGGRGTLPDIGNYAVQFIVREELDDCLLCTPFYQPVDGASGWWVPQGYDVNLGNGAVVLEYVAKPTFLQKSVWNGKTVVVGGESISIAYDGTTVGQRVLTGTAATQTQRINAPYLKGDVIWARKGLTGLTAPTGGPIVWADENDAARLWVTTAVTGSPGAGGLALLGGPVNAVAVTGASVAKYESYWRDFNGNGGFYLGGGDIRTIGVTTNTLLPGLIYALPFLVPRACVVNSVYLHSTTTTSGGLFRVGIYSNLATSLSSTFFNRPDSLLFGSGNIDMSATTGFLGVTASLPVADYTLLWLVALGNDPGTGNTSSLTLRTRTELWNIGGTGNVGPDDTRVGWSGTQSFGALPATFPNYTLMDTQPVDHRYDNLPWIGVRLYLP